MIAKPQGQNKYISYNHYCPDGIVVAISLHSFYDRHASTDQQTPRRKFLAEISHRDFPFAMAQQMHSSRVAAVETAGEIPNVDGLATNIRGLFLTIAVADCLPIYLWSQGAECIALLHAGWRGTAAGIASEGVRLMMERYGAEPGALAAILGPCICPSCYEVGPEVTRRFGDSVLSGGRSGRFHLDLRKANLQQLIEAGVPEEAIQSDDRCTCCRPDLFFSYRREGERAGRLIAALALLPAGETVTSER